MTLAFSQTINGKPTYFPEKIWSALRDHVVTKELGDYLNSTFSTGVNILECKPKIHTIREDKNDRWCVGNKIHFVINNRTKNRLQFAPVLKVKNIQEVFMTYAYNDLIQISIDGHELFGYNERLEFAQNDGFDTWEDFFNWFYPLIDASEDKCFRGKVIHWTDYNY